MKLFPPPPTQVTATVRRRLRGAVSLWLTAVVAVGAISSPGWARQEPVTDEAMLLSLANDLRETVGAPPLEFDGAASEVARRWADTMAAEGRLSHNPDLQLQLPPGWMEVAENVAMGGTVEEVHQALVGSPHHYDNLVHPGFNRVGVAVVRTGVQLYVVEDFLNSATTTTRRTSTTTTAPVRTAPTATTTATTSTTVAAVSSPPLATAGASGSQPPESTPGNGVAVMVGPPDGMVAVKVPVATTRIAYVLAQLRAWDRQR